MVAELTRAQADLLQPSHLGLLAPSLLLPRMATLILYQHLLINMRTIILLGMRRLLWLS
jgi:hypothetical protein